MAGLLAILALVSTGGALFAQDDGSDGPAAAADDIPPFDEVAVPAIGNGRDPKVVENGWKYFYFYRPDTTYEEDYADIADCYRFLPVPNARTGIPTFVPWETKTGVNIIKPDTYRYGLVGAFIGSLVDGPIIRRTYQSHMRRCMEPKGYERYPADETTWEAIIDGYSQHSIAVQAKLVALGQPDAEPLPVTR